MVRPADPPEHDVVVIGAGVGGLVAAARLVLAGFRPLLLEEAERLGGRFSTIERDGFLLPTGAVAVETSGPFWEVFGDLGIDPGLREPDPPFLIRVRGRDLRPGAAVWDHLIARVTRNAARVAEGIAEGRAGSADETVSLAEWARRHTRSRTVLSLIQSLAASIFTVNAEELPAGVFFRNLRETGGYKRFGFAPDGNAAIAEAIAAAIVARGGAIRRRTAATALELEDGAVAAVHVRRADGTPERIPAPAVVSGIGPRNPARLLEPTPARDAFAERVRDVQTTSILALAFSTRERIVPRCGIWAFTDTERLCNLANLSDPCPRLAPEGRTLYEAYGVPRPSVGGDYDAEAERALLERDLRRVLPGFATADVLLFKAMRGDRAPAQQARPGHDLDVRTPLPNLVEVGDGVKPYGWIGTTACAESARRAVEVLQAAPATGTV